MFHRTVTASGQCVEFVTRQVLQYRISNEELLDRIGLQSIDIYVTKRQLSWAGHVTRIYFDCLPQKMLSSWVRCNRPRGSPKFINGCGLKVFK